jgi:hypothetical protein
MNTRGFICVTGSYTETRFRSTAFRRSTIPNYRFGLIYRFGSNSRWEKRCGILAQPIVVSTGVVARGRCDNPTIVASGYKVQKTVEARLIVKDGAPNAPNTASPSIINGNTSSASSQFSGASEGSIEHGDKDAQPENAAAGKCPQKSVVNHPYGANPTKDRDIFHTSAKYPVTCVESPEPIRAV